MIHLLYHFNNNKIKQYIGTINRIGINDDISTTPMYNILLYISNTLCTVKPRHALSFSPP